MNDVLTRYDQLTVRIPPGKTRIARVGLTYTHTHARIISHLQEEYKEKQIECEESAMALMNLQMVLEQFQSQKEAEVSKHPLAMLALPLPCTVRSVRSSWFVNLGQVRDRQSPQTDCRRARQVTQALTGPGGGIRTHLLAL
jgi:hypothetical protein